MKKLILLLIFVILFLGIHLSYLGLQAKAQTAPNALELCQSSCVGTCQPKYGGSSACESPIHAPCSNMSCILSYECLPYQGPESTPTPPPICGGPCTINQTQCPIECPVCDFREGDGTTSATCGAGPTPTRTPTPTDTPPTDTPVPTRTPTPTRGITPTPTRPTLTNTPVPTRTPTPTPTRTPTPRPTNTPTPTPFPFSDAMCKCDGIEIGQVTSGQDVTVTAYGKVEGNDTNYAKISSFSFFAAKGDSGSSNITIFNRSRPIAAQIVSTSQNLIKNKASWTFKFPSNPEAGKEYRVWNQIKCERKATAGVQVASAGIQRVLAETTEQNFFQRVASFFTGLFGGNKSDQTASTPQPTQTIQSSDQLQLDTFKIGKIIPDPATACYMVKVKFDK